MPKFRWRDIPGIVLVVFFVSFCLYWANTHPEWMKMRPSGFGPEWQCTPTGRGGPDFCIKKSLLHPTKPD